MPATETKLESVHQVTSLPLSVFSPPADIRNDPDFLDANGVRILMSGNPAFAVAVKAIYDCFQHIKDGSPIDELSDKEASPELLRKINRTDELVQLQRKFLRL